MKYRTTMVGRDVKRPVHDSRRQRFSSEPTPCVTYLRARAASTTAEITLLRRQRHTLHTFASQHNYHVTGEFADRGSAAWALRHGNLRRLLMKCRSSRVAAVLVASADRLARTLTDYVTLVDLFRRRRTEVIVPASMQHTDVRMAGRRRGDFPR
jgi:DNA invertase Pin-like site-specific DNA recombinase